MESALHIRPVTTFEDYAPCAELQRLVWGDHDVVPATVFAFQHAISGLTLGAWKGPRLVACCMSFPGRFAGQWVQWSHLTAVHPDCRDQGVGRAIKLAQREAVLAMGFSRICWSFDPLESRNARLNFARLGGTSRLYEVDFYGTVDAAPLLGLPTDRLLVEWDLTREFPPPAEAALPEACVLLRDEHGWPSQPRLDLEGATLGLEIPPDLQELKARDLDCARAWREATRTAFRHYLGERGYTVDGFTRLAGPRSLYRLIRGHHTN